MLPFLFLVIASVQAKYGVDLYPATSTSTFKCFRNNGFDGFFITRGWRSNGKFDTNAPGNLKNAQSSGFSSSMTDVYFYPCVSCGNAAGQVSSFWSAVGSNKMNFKRLWFDIEGTWYSSTSSNQKFFEELINKARSIGIVYGIYASSYYWSSLFGSSYKFKYASSIPLWYPHYDNKATFSDFKAFGGWTTPYIKQYAGDKTLCSTDVDYDYGH